MKKKFKWIIVPCAVIVGFIILFMACGYSYIHFGFPPNKNGLDRLNSITHFKLSDRDVYFGSTGGIDDWQVYFKFVATKEEVESIVTILKLGEGNIHTLIPDFYWWAPESENARIYSKDLGSSFYYLHYNATNREVHFADVHI